MYFFLKTCFVPIPRQVPDNAIMLPDFSFKALNVDNIAENVRQHCTAMNGTVLQCTALLNV